jgi:Ni/Fe-hydrogenase subunit HybB-like protein
MSRAAPLGGRIFTPRFNLLLAFGGLAIAILIWRFIVGLGPTTGMNDGYPWGIWIAFDVVTGTGIACGGYAMALMVYIFNKGKYHHLVRPALLTTALGYSVAGASVFVDIGRWWNAWKVPSFFWTWNFNSALLEVALCIMSYIMVAWIELSPSFLPARFKGYLEKALPFFIALGILLPTMHQSSLGSLMMVAQTKVHPLWHSQLLPLLFLVSVIGMGYAGAVLEATVSGKVFRLEPEWDLLTKIGKAVSLCFIAFLAIRLVGLALNGFPGFGANGMTLLFIVEMALFAIPAWMLLDERRVRDPGKLFAAAMVAVLAGAVYRFDVYLVAFDPGSNWHYFPSIPEMLVTIGFVALEIAAYTFIVKLFPILRPARSTP